MLKRMVTTWKNVKSNPIKVKQVKFEVKMENETQLRDRIAKLDKKIGNKKQ